MKHILFMFMILLCIFVFALETQTPLLNTLQYSDYKNISLSSGIMYNSGKYFSYSLFSYNAMKSINQNWSVYYKIDYLNRNYDNNLVNTGIGFNYTKNKFSFSVYVNKTMTETDVYKLKYLNSLK